MVGCKRSTPMSRGILLMLELDLFLWMGEMIWVVSEDDKVLEMFDDLGRRRCRHIYMPYYGGIRDYTVAELKKRYGWRIKIAP